MIFASPCTPQVSPSQESGPDDADPIVIDLDRPRLHQLHERVASAIPCDPEEARADLRAMNLVELLARYVNWADRFVPPRPRRVVTWEGFRRHGTADQHWEAVEALAAKIEAGEDLKPFLSERIERCGYVRPKADETGKPRGVEWRDKDYALNGFETHHLHLSTRIEADGFSERTRALLYVSFLRQDAFFVMVGDHNSFDDGTLARAMAEARVGTALEFQGIAGLGRERTDRENNALQRRGFTTAMSVGANVVLGAMLSTAGTSPFHTMHADRMAEALADLDPKLDQPGFGREWFEGNGRPYPDAPNYEWVPQYGDLCLVETTTGILFPILKWRR